MRKKVSMQQYPTDASLLWDSYRVVARLIHQWEEEIDVYAICKKGKRTEEEINREHSEEFQAMQSFRAGYEVKIACIF